MPKILIRSILTVLFLAFVTVVAENADMRYIRVAILRDVGHFTMAIPGRYRVLDNNTGRRLSSEAHLWPVVVELDNGRIRVGQQVFEEKSIMIDPSPGVDVRVNNKHFRGNLVLVNNGGQSLTVVNFVDLEEYIRGVLYHEVSDKWPMEAIKAQAVATRTYALYSMKQYANRDYDVTNDIYSQVYGGKSGERYRTNLAVKRTRGKVLSYEGRIFPAFFHANSGGITEDARELWNIDIPPLRGGVESPYSVNSPHYRWKLNMRLKDIQDKLNARGYELGLIKAIEVTARTGTGRVRTLTLTMRDGAVKTVDGKAFREALGPNILRSNLYDVLMKGWYVDFLGRGWGHGVGLDQWGAYNMASQRFSCQDILSFYYPQSELVDLGSLR